MLQVQSPATRLLQSATTTPQPPTTPAHLTIEEHTAEIKVSQKQVQTFYRCSSEQPLDGWQLFEGKKSSLPQHGHVQRAKKTFLDLLREESTHRPWLRKREEIGFFEAADPMLFVKLICRVTKSDKNKVRIYGHTFCALSTWLCARLSGEVRSGSAKTHFQAFVVDILGKKKSGKEARQAEWMFENLHVTLKIRKEGGCVAKLLDRYICTIDRVVPSYEQSQPEPEHQLDAIVSQVKDYADKMARQGNQHVLESMLWTVEIVGSIDQGCVRIPIACFSQGLTLQQSDQIQTFLKEIENQDLCFCAMIAPAIRSVGHTIRSARFQIWDHIPPTITVTDNAHKQFLFGAYCHITLDNPKGEDAAIDALNQHQPGKDAFLDSLRQYLFMKLECVEEGENSEDDWQEIEPDDQQEEQPDPVAQQTATETPPPQQSTRAIAQQQPQQHAKPSGKRNFDDMANSYDFPVFQDKRMWGVGSTRSNKGTPNEPVASFKFPFAVVVKRGGEENLMRELKDFVKETVNLDLSSDEAQDMLPTVEQRVSDDTSVYWVVLSSNKLPSTSARKQVQRPKQVFETWLNHFLSGEWSGTPQQALDGLKTALKDGTRVSFTAVAVQPFEQTTAPVAQSATTDTNP